MKDANEKEKLQKLIESIVAEEIEVLEEGLITDHPFLGGFIQPFTDIFKTAKAELTKLSARVFENTKKLAKQTVYFAIPFIGASAITKAEQEAKEAIDRRIANINKQYRDVYERTWEQFKNPDMLGFTFLLDPVLPFTKNFALALKTIKDGGPAVLGLLEVLTGGNEEITKFKNKWIEVTKMTPYGTSMSGGGGYGGYGFDDIGDFGGFDGGGEAINPPGKMLEQQQLSGKSQQKARFAKKQPDREQLMKQMAKELQQVLQNPSVQQSIQNSPIVRDFQAAGVQALTNSIKPVMSAKTYQDLQKVVPDFKKIEAEILKQIPDEEATPEQMEQWKQDFVPEFKEIYKQMFAEQIKGMLDKEGGKTSQALMGKILKQLQAM